MAARLIEPFMTYNDANGVPLAGGKLNFFVSGTVNTPKNTFSDDILFTPNTNPIVLDAAGRAAVDVWGDGDYKLVVTNSANVTQATFDPVSGSIFQQPVINIAELTSLLKTNLTNGDQIAVSGYDTQGDGGGGDLYWTTQEPLASTAENGVTIFEADEGGTGRWIRIIDDFLTVKMAGAKGDDSTDDTAAIQSVYDLGGEVYFPDGTYLYTPGPGKGYVSNNFIHGPGTLKLHLPIPPGPATIMQLLRPKDYENMDNVTVIDITLDGNRDGNDFSGVGNDGDAHGLTFWGVSNAFVDNVTAVNCWTDGFYLAFTHSSKGVRRNNTDVRIGTIFADNCGRQGMSIISCSGMTMDALYAKDIQRISPGAVIDFEANTVVDVTENITIGALYGENTRAGVLFVGVNVIDNISVGRINCKNITHTNGLSIKGSSNINIGSAYIEKNEAIGSSFPALDAQDYKNVWIGSLNLVLNSSVSSGLSHMVDITAFTDVNDNTNLRIENLFIDGSRQSGIRTELGTEVSIGSAVLKNINQEGSGSSAAFFRGKCLVEYLEVIGSTQEFSLFTGNGSDVMVNSGRLAMGTTNVVRFDGVVPPVIGKNLLGADGQSLSVIDQEFILASEVTQVLPTIVSNRGYFRIIAKSRPKYTGTFGAFTTEIPVDFGSGSRLSYQLTSGGSSADDLIRVWPSSANTISFKNNTTGSITFRVIIEPAEVVNGAV